MAKKYCGSDVHPLNRGRMALFFSSFGFEIVFRCRGPIARAVFSGHEIERGGEYIGQSDLGEEQ